MKKMLAFGAVGELFVAVHGKEAPTDAEWDRWIDAWMDHQKGVRLVRIVVFTRGGAPTSAQRHRLEERTRHFTGLGSKIAILSSATLPRVVMNVMATMTQTWSSLRSSGPDSSPKSVVQYRAFDEPDLRSALYWLEVPPALAPDVKRLVETLDAELERG